MTPVRRLSFLLAALCLAAGVSSGASGSRITLRLQDATLAEVAAAVTRASGVSVDAGPVLSAPPAPGPAPRASFAWENASLDRVLRDICARFQCGCSGSREGYRLYPAGPSGKSRFALERDGVRVAVAGVAVTERRSRTFPAGARRGEPHRTDLNISLLVDLDQPEGDWTARVEELSARDDLGNRLAARPASLSWHTFPGQRIGDLRLPLEDPRARRLAWVAGELVVSRRGAGARIELPYPASGAVAQRRVDADLAIAVSHARPAAPTPAVEYPDAPAAPLSQPMFEAEHGPSLLMRVHRAVDPENPDASMWFPAPRALGWSGRSYPARGGSGGASVRDGRALYYTVTSFPGAAEPLEKLVWELHGAAERERRIPFRFVDLPIPGMDGLPVQWPWFHTGRELPAAPPPPFYRAGAATLRSEVRLRGAPAPGGALTIGLSTRDGAEWSPARWCRAAVGPSGAAVLEGVAPGRYRVLRQYVISGTAAARMVGHAEATPAGRWLNSETEVVVPEAGVVELPPLDLTAAPPPADAAPAGAANAARVFEPGGIRMEPATVRMESGRATRWEGMQILGFFDRGQVTFSSRLKLDGALAQSVPFARNVSAADDLGTILRAPDEEIYFPGTTGPGGTHRLFNLSAAHPKARKLAWVEGELFSYRRRRRVRLEAPFPPPGRSVLVRDGANLLATVANEALPPTAPPAAPAEPDLLPPIGLPEPGEPRVRFRVCYRDGVLQAIPGTAQDGQELVSPTAVGKSGATYRPRGGGGTSTSVQEWVLHAHRATYSAAREPLEKLVWEFDVWDTPEPIGFFRMRDVPLPPRPPQAGVGVPGEAARPQAGRAKVTVRVLRGDRPVSDGTVHFGLSARTGSSWGPVRWVEAPVDESGRARLEGLRPGQYRVALRYAPDPAAAPVRRAPVGITLAAGRELQLPPFRFGGPR